MEKRWYLHVELFIIINILLHQVCISRQLRTNLLYIYSTPPDDGLHICPKHVEVEWRNKLRINSASSWF